MKYILFLIIIIFINLDELFSQGMIIMGGADIKVSGSPYIIIRDGGLDNFGTYSGANEELQFIGITGDTIAGNSLDVYSLVINNTGGMVSSTDTLISYDIDILAGSFFEISPAKFLTVVNNLTNASGTSGLVLHSDLNGSASLISNSPGLQATVEHFISGNRWYILSSSTPGESISDFLSNNDSIPHAPAFRAMTYYDESSGGWAPYLTNTSPGTMDAGQAYLVRTSLDTVIYFQGNLRNTSLNDFSIPKANRGWHSIGNPFSASLKISESADPLNNFLTVNLAELDPEHVAVYVWDEQPGYSGKNRNDYVALNLLSDTSYLQPGQGFMVRAKDGGGNLDFTTEMRAHHNNTVFNKKSAGQKSKPYIKLQAYTSDSEAETRIYFTGSASEGLDPGYDAGLFGALKNLSLYTELVEGQGSKFMIQALPISGFPDYTIPVGLECSENTTVVFKADQHNLPDGFMILLEDREKETITDLKSHGSYYQVEVSSGISGTGRFFLHTYDPRTVDLGPGIKSGINIYKARNELIIKGDNLENSELSLFDLSGRVLINQILDDPFVNKIELGQIQQGLYIVYLSSVNVKECRKIFIE